MLGPAVRVYRETRKRRDQVFNIYVMRPIAAAVVSLLAGTRVTPNQLTLFSLAVFVAAASMLISLPTRGGELAAVGALYVSYCFDCADGMLARHNKVASKVGHLFDFLTDELKALLLVAALAVRIWRVGGIGLDARMWDRGDPRFLLAGIAGIAILASAISLTSFVRRPEISGRDTTVEAFYETAADASTASPLAHAGSYAMTFLRWLNHYPSHLWLWVLLGRLDVYFWIYVSLNAAYLAQGWLRLVLRFGRS